MYVYKHFLKAVCTIALIFYSHIGILYSSDYIIIDHPRQIKILNHYEQSLVPSDLYSLPDYTPFRVTATDVMLGDQFTHAMQVFYADKGFYLVKDSNGELINFPPISSYRLYRQVTEIEDTVMVRSGQQLDVFISGENAGSVYKLAEGQKFYRIFSTHSQVYVRLSGSIAGHGWVNNADNDKWQKVVPRLATKQLPQTMDISQQVRDITNRNNLLYSRIFSDLGNVSGKRYGAPTWQLSISDNTIYLQFTPQDYGGQFKESIARYSNEIEFILLNSNWVLVRSADPLRFEIHEKTDN